MTLETFYSRISGIVNYGAEADSEIPNAVRDAAKFIEQNYTYKYMERFVYFTLNSGDRIIDLPDKDDYLVKSIQFIRIPQDDGKFYYLDAISPLDVRTTKTMQPYYYWLDGMDHIVFDNTADKDYQVEMSYNRITKWPTDEQQTPALLGQFEPYLLAEAMMNLAPYIDDANVLATYERLSQRHQRASLLADEEMRRLNEQPEMGYASAEGGVNSFPERRRGH